MLFNSFHFFIFLCTVLLVHGLLNRWSYWQRWVLLLASAYFYGQWHWAYLSLIYITVISDFFIGRAIPNSSNPKRLIVLSLCINLGILGFFKYSGLMNETVLHLIHMLGVDATWDFWHVVLPVGISFYTFQSLSYTIDIYRGQLKPRQSILDYSLFITFFPQLVAGPIVRAVEFFKELDRPSWYELKDKAMLRHEGRRGMSLIMIGLFKKVVVADNLAPFVDQVFSHAHAYSALECLFAVYAFAVQIYCDFSGYTDIAIGVACLLGFRFPQNFNSPYAALSTRDFWRRWHMTLSRWLRDYLYISLGGNRRGEARTLINLMLTMLLGGLWHGAAWNFVVWGGLHGIYLAVERYVLERSAWYRSAPPWGKVLQWVVTFHLVCLAWIFFRAESFSQAWTLLSQLFVASEWHRVSALPAYGLWLIPLLVLLQIPAAYWRWREYMIVGPGWIYTLVVSLTGVTLVLFAPQAAAPFIYFQF